MLLLRLSLSFFFFFFILSAQCASIKEQPKYGVLMLAYLLEADGDRARLLWCRVPEEQKQKNVELKAVSLCERE